MSSKAPLISVLIATRNEAKHLAETLESLCAQDLGPEELEVLILDGGSTDQTLEIARRFEQQLPGLRILNNPGVLSAAGWNLGLREAGAPAVAILSGHVKLQADHLRLMLDALRPEIAGVGGRAMPVGDGPLSRLIALAFSSVLGNGGATFMAGSVARSVETIAFGAYWRRNLLEIGGFDEQIVRGQDWDLNLRLRQRGHTLWYVPGVEARYTTRSDFRSLWRRQYLAGLWKPYIHRKSAAPFLLRHWLPSLFVMGTVLTSIAALFSGPARWLFLLGAFLHIGAACVQGRRLGVVWRELPAFWWALWLIHTAYGAGMIKGFVSAPAKAAP